MPASGSADRRWEVATDPAEIHALLLASDRYQAQRYGLAAPVRDVQSTRRRVASGSVHAMRGDGRPVAMFTLSWQAPFADPESLFPAATRPAYLLRLAIDPELIDGHSMLGLSCLRYAVELATRDGADALRSEANPDLTDTRALLDLLDFRQHGPVREGNGLRRVYLQKHLPHEG